MNDSQDMVKSSDNEGTIVDLGALIAIGYLLLGALVLAPILFAEVIWGFTHKEFLYLWGEGPLAAVLVVTVIVTHPMLVSRPVSTLSCALLGAPMLKKLLWRIRFSPTRSRIL